MSLSIAAKVQKPTLDFARIEVWLTTNCVSPVGLTVPGICIVDKGSSNWRKNVVFRKNLVLKANILFGAGEAKNIHRHGGVRKPLKKSSKNTLFLFIMGKQSLLEKRDEFFSKTYVSRQILLSYFPLRNQKSGRRSAAGVRRWGSEKHRVLKGHEIAAIHPFLIDLKNHNVTLPLKGNVTDRQTCS